MSITESQIHDCYEHYELKTYEKLFQCVGCKKKGSGERYACNLCGDELHKECRYPKSEVSHENFGGYVFKFYDKPFTKKKREDLSKFCDACGKDICGFNYHCEEGKLDLHPCCVKLEKKKLIDGTIFDLVTKVSSECGQCGLKNFRDEKVQGWSYVSRCRKYHFHVDCIFEKEVESQLQRLLPALPSTLVNDLNRRVVTATSNKMSITGSGVGDCHEHYHDCGQCGMKKSDPSSRANQEDSRSITGSQNHDCYKHYELKKCAKFFQCVGCKRNGFGERYACNLCGHELHKECRYPKSEVSHENFGGYVFKFYDKPFTSLDKKKRKEISKYCCDACGMDICGFNYHCEEGKLDLHPCCARLEKKKLIDGTIFDLVTEVSSSCGKCGEKKMVSRDEEKVLGWSYVSRCRKYHFHVYCLSEMVQEAWMKHGDMALEKMDLSKLVKYRNKGGGNTFLATIKSFVTILLSVLLGDPTMLIPNVAVELFSFGFQL